MGEIQKIKHETKKEFYEELLFQAQGLLSGERDLIANLANVSGLLYHSMDEINWAGFYLFKEGQLVLGPFQGKPACIRIELGRGVCGAAAIEQKTQRIGDVHLFAGHIACDGASNSEIVVPLIKKGELLGVMDIDSPILNRFDPEDQRYLEALASKLVEGCNWPEQEKQKAPF